MGVLIPPNAKDDHSALPGWIIESLKSVKYIDTSHFSVPFGKKVVELVADRESALSQILRTLPDKTYVLSFSVGDSANACSSPLEVEAVTEKQSIHVPYASKGVGGFVRAQLVFRAEKERTRIRFLSNGYSMTTHARFMGPLLMTSGSSASATHADLPDFSFATYVL